MSIFLHLMLLTSAANDPLPFNQDEPTCIVRELDTMSAAKKPFKLVDAVDPCRQRYHWTNDEVQIALGVTRALVTMRFKRREAAEAGVDLTAVDRVFDLIGDQNRSVFGWEGDPRPIPESLSDICNRFPESFTDNQRVKAGLVIAFSAISYNSIKEFIKYRNR